MRRRKTALLGQPLGTGRARILCERERGGYRERSIADARQDLS